MSEPLIKGKPVAPDEEIKAMFKHTEGKLPILENPRLVKMIMNELDKKVVGEYGAKLSIFLHSCHIYVANPSIKLHAFINSESSTGKSYVVQKIAELFPEDVKIVRNKLTDEVFTYWRKGEKGWTWDGKLLVLDDVRQSLLESNTFKTMLSEGSKATIIENQKAVDIEIKGTPNVLLTTAENKPGVEVENRFAFIRLDESKEQTINVYQKQAELAQYGIKPKYNNKILDAIKELKPVEVQVPFADKLWGIFPANNVRGRRDFPRFLELIKANTALHQKQRSVEGKQVVAQGEDYEVARSVLSSMDFNSELVVLDHNMRKAYNTCVELSEGNSWFTVEEAWKKNPFVSDRQWVRYLGNLAKKGFVKVDILDLDTPGRKPKIYRASETSTYVLPDFKKVMGDDL